MSGKVRHVDFYPDEYIAGVGGRLSAVDQGVYWMICSLVYSRGGPIDDDHVWLSHLFVDTHWRTVRAAIDRLIQLGKVSRSEGGVITVKRCASELQKALTRSSQAFQNGGKGGRPPKENNYIPKPEAFQDEKLTTNHQPPTNKKKEKEDTSLRSVSKKSKKSEPPKKTASRVPTGYAELSRVLDDERTKAVIEHRQKFKKPLTAHAAKLLARQFEKCLNPNEAADEMVARGWLGFKPEWLEARQANAKPVPKAQPPPHQYDPNIPPEQLEEMLADIEREYGGRRIR